MLNTLVLLICYVKMQGKVWLIFFFFFFLCYIKTVSIDNVVIQFKWEC